MVEKQNTFLLMIAKLINKANELGYKVTAGEFWRTPEMAKIYSQQGKGIIKSLHIDRLAADLNIFKDGIYLNGSEKWHIPLLEILGKYFESIGGTWGGRFDRKDYNHFSLAHNGVK